MKIDGRQHPSDLSVEEEHPFLVPLSTVIENVVCVCEGSFDRKLLHDFSCHFIPLQQLVLTSFSWYTELILSQ